MASRDTQETRAVPADKDGRAFRPSAVTVGGSILELVPATAERAATIPEDTHHLCSLAQRLDPLCGGRPLHPECPGVGVGAARAQADYYPPGRHRVESCRHPGHHGWGAVRVGQDERNRYELPRPGGERCQSGPAFGAIDAEDVIEGRSVVPKALAFPPHGFQFLIAPPILVDSHHETHLIHHLLGTWQPAGGPSDSRCLR